MNDQAVIRDVYQQGAFCYTYGPNHKPIAEVNISEKIRLYAPDAFENKIKSNREKFSDVCVYPYLNPQVGPVFIKGAKPGDTLIVNIHVKKCRQKWVFVELTAGTRTAIMI